MASTIYTYKAKLNYFNNLKIKFLSAEIYNRLTGTIVYVYSYIIINLFKYTFRRSNYLRYRYSIQYITLQLPIYVNLLNIRILINLGLIILFPISILALSLSIIWNFRLKYTSTRVLSLVPRIYVGININLSVKQRLKPILRTLNRDAIFEIKVSGSYVRKYTRLIRLIPQLVFKYIQV